MFDMLVWWAMALIIWLGYDTNDYARYVIIGWAWFVIVTSFPICTVAGRDLLRTKYAGLTKDIDYLGNWYFRYSPAAEIILLCALGCWTTAAVYSYVYYHIWTFKQEIDGERIPE